MERPWAGWRCKIQGNSSALRNWEGVVDQEAGIVLDVVACELSFEGRTGFKYVSDSGDIMNKVTRRVMWGRAALKQRFM